MSDEEYGCVDQEASDIAKVKVTDKGYLLLPNAQAVLSPMNELPSGGEVYICWNGHRWEQHERGLLEQFRFGIISPTRGVAYSVSDVLSKFTVRSSYEIDCLRIVSFGTGPCGDQDFMVTAMLSTFSSSWCESVDGILKVCIPLHRTGGGTWRWGVWETGYQEARHIQLPPLPCTLEAISSKGDVEGLRWDWPVHELDGKITYEILWTDDKYKTERTIIALVQDAFLQRSVYAAIMNTKEEKYAER